MSIAPCLKSGQRGGRCHASSASAARVAAEAREEGGLGEREFAHGHGERGGRIHPSRPHMPDPARTRLRE